MNIVFTGLSGVPYKKRACDLRLLSFAECFVATGNDVTILNRTPIISENDKKEAAIISDKIRISELFNNGHVIKTSIQNACFLILSFFAEYIWFISNKRKKRIDIIHVYTGHFIDFIHYFFISRFIGAKVVYQYVEVRTAKNNKGIYHKINSYLVDNFGYRFFDGVISISDFISDKLKVQSEKLLVIKVPPICDITYFDRLSKQYDYKVEKNYIVFCGSANYLEPIKLIIDSFKMSNIYSEYKLYLILSGSEDSLIHVKKMLTKSMSILNGLPYSELVRFYLGAKALLIPLRNTTEDIARFPNKICEYTASRGVVVTTGYGEINNYFIDNYNALIAEDFTVDSYTTKLNQLFEKNDTQIEGLKNRAYDVCRKNFDIEVYKNELDKFLLNIKNKH